MTDTSRLSWQLLMVGPGIDRITPDVQDKLASLLDLLPATATINVQTDVGYVTVSRDWPSHRMETVDSLVDAIATASGIIHISVPPGAPVQEYFTSFDEAIKARDDSKGVS